MTIQNINVTVEKMIEKRKSAEKEQVNSHLWSIVLAGGEGKRLAPMVKRWLGEERPKQYCTFTGTRSGSGK